MNNATDRILGVFAKQPMAGRVKTRLAAATSADWAERVAQAFLEDTLERFREVQAHRAIVYTPSSAAAYFQQLARGRFDLQAQADGDLGSRLGQFFTQARRQGFSRIVVIGADSPTLPVDWVERAFQLLDRHDVVIGPACDGGYCLLGGTDNDFDLFTAIPWSTPHVLTATIQRIQDSSARLALLPPWYDVDTVDDWALLCGHVRAMRRAGLDPGVPRVERLIQEHGGVNS